MISDVRILLADDHALVRSSLAERLARESGFRVVATAADADDAIEKARSHEVDVILMDIDMPGTPCFAAARQITVIRPKAKIIFVSGFFNDRYIDQALEANAHGYVTKTESPETAIAAIREVLSGGAYFSEEVKSRLVVDRCGARLANKTRTRGSTMTPREMEAMRHLVRGLSKKEIAKQMHISLNTVKRHVDHLMEKLDVHSTVELVRFAIREGLAEP